MFKHDITLVFFIIRAPFLYFCGINDDFNRFVTFWWIKKTLFFCLETYGRAVYSSIDGLNLYSLAFSSIYFLWPHSPPTFIPFSLKPPVLAPRPSDKVLFSDSPFPPSCLLPFYLSFILPQSVEPFFRFIYFLHPPFCAGLILSISCCSPYIAPPLFFLLSFPSQFPFPLPFFVVVFFIFPPIFSFSHFFLLFSCPTPMLSIIVFHLKVRSHEIFDFWFLYYQTSPLLHTLKSFCIWLWIHQEIQIWNWLSGINDTAESKHFFGNPLLFKLLPQRT